MLSAFAGFLLLLMVKKSLLGIPGFGMIADTQLSHVIIKDLWENSPQAVVLLLMELDVMGVSQSVWIKVGCNNTIKFLCSQFSLKIAFPCHVLQVILEVGE